MTGEEFRGIRTELGLTQAQLGEALGLSYVEIYRKETGRCAISATQALAMTLMLQEARRLKATEGEE